MLHPYGGEDGNRAVNNNQFWFDSNNESEFNRKAANHSTGESHLLHRKRLTSTLLVNHHPNGSKKRNNLAPWDLDRKEKDFKAARVK